MSVLLTAGGIGMLFTLLAFGMGWTVAVAVFYGLLYVARKAKGDVSGSLMAASILFWIMLLFNPGVLFIGFVSMFLLEIGCNTEERRED
ncbi:MAG TPA: hypothetical protein DCZ94_09065 [Lentisphaeria bacterium]|nr:MAG: hypothetical protein A2X48_23340 [Lentisphaerae bacterium GWF2_49_21]HBC87090.1 hypothetical protein [Lentisphaeria bacterium]